MNEKSALETTTQDFAKVPFKERINSFIYLYKQHYEIPAAFKLFELFFSSKEAGTNPEETIERISKEGVVLTEKSIEILIKNHKYLFLSDNKNYLKNICTLFDSQETQKNISDIYMIVSEFIEDKQKTLDFLARYSKNPYVWSFLTSVLEWNVGTKSLRYKIKELNEHYDGSKGHFLFHGEGFSYPTESDFVQSWLEKRS